MTKAMDSEALPAATRLSESELLNILADSSYEVSHRLCRPAWCRLYLLAPSSPQTVRFINRHLNRRPISERAELEVVRGEYAQLRKDIAAFLGTHAMDGISTCLVFLNWEYSLVLYAAPEQMKLDTFLQSASEIEDALRNYLDRRYPESWLVKSPAGESIQDLGRMYLEARIDMEVLQFTGSCPSRKERLSEHSPDGKFDAEQKKTERDYYMRLCACDADGAIDCLDRLLEMAGHGIYKDVSVFKQQMCTCMELAAVILGFRSGREQLLTDLIPAYAMDIGKDGAIRNREEFRAATIQMIYILKESVYFASNIKTSAVRDAVALIQNRYNDPQFSAQKLAAEMNFQMSYISKLFRAETNYTISGYIRHLRIEKSKELLRRTERTISEVATNAGFSSEKTFYRVFMAEEGITPSVYRKQAHGERNETN